MVSEEFDSIFIHVPKCAGTSINAFLKSNGFTMKSLHQEKDGSSDNETGRYKIGAARRLKRAYSEREWSGYFKFAFVRNPWDKVLSSFANHPGATGAKSTLSLKILYLHTHLKIMLEIRCGTACHNVFMCATTMESL